MLMTKNKHDSIQTRTDTVVARDSLLNNYIQWYTNPCCANNSAYKKVKQSGENLL